jgi:hypothetical protein
MWSGPVDEVRQQRPASTKVPLHRKFHGSKAGHRWCTSAESAVASCSLALMFVGALFGCREVEEAVACLARPHQSRGRQSSPWCHDENGAAHDIVMVATDVLSESAACAIDVTVKADRSTTDEVCDHGAKASAMPRMARGPWARCLGDGVLARRGHRGQHHG